jgi:hypothetical protein
VTRAAAFPATASLQKRQVVGVWELHGKRFGQDHGSSTLESMQKRLNVVGIKPETKQHFAILGDSPRIMLERKITPERRPET